MRMSVRENFQMLGRSGGEAHQVLDGRDKPGIPVGRPANDLFGIAIDIGNGLASPTCALALMPSVQRMTSCRVAGDRDYPVPEGLACHCFDLNFMKRPTT
jgi:hypothetical protein